MSHIFSNMDYENMVFVYSFCKWNAAVVVEEYYQRFSYPRIMEKKVVIKTFSTLCDTGRLSSPHITDERTRIPDVEDLVEQSPAISSRRIASQLEILQTRVICILLEQGLYPYYRQPGDYVKRMQFCLWIIINGYLVWYFFCKS